MDVTVDRRSSTSEGGGPASLLRWQNIHHHSVSTKKSRRAARCCQWFSRRLLECACVRACMHLASAHAPLCAFFSRNLSPCLARWSKLLDAMYMEIITPCTSIGHHHTRLRSTPYPRNNQSRSSWTLIKPNKAGRPPMPRLFAPRGIPAEAARSHPQTPLSFVLHTECRAHVPSWLPRSPSCELASDCLVAHLLPRQWHSLAACPRHVCVRAGPLLTSGLAMFVARQPIAEVVARLSRGRATTWLFL